MARRPDALFSDALMALDVAVAAGKLEHTFGDHGAVDPGVELTGALQSLGITGGEVAIANIETGGDQGGVKAGGTCARPLGLNHLDCPALGGKGPGEGGPGDARAEDDDGAGSVGRGGFTRKGRLQPLALATMAGAFLDGKARLGEASSDSTCDGEGGEACAGPAERRDPGHDRR